jgi:hypothetical protein
MRALLRIAQRGRSARAGTGEEGRLRAALLQEAGGLPVRRDGMTRIRARIHATGAGAGARRPAWLPAGRRWVPAVGALALAAVVATGTFAGVHRAQEASTASGALAAETPTPGAPTAGGPPDPVGVPAAPGAATAAPSGGAPVPGSGTAGVVPEVREGGGVLAQTVGPVAPPLPSAAASPSPSSGVSTRPAAMSLTVALYYIRNVQGSGLLYREFASVSSTTDRPTTAVRELLTRAPADSDYSTVLPSFLRLSGYTRTGSTAVVRLSGETPPGPLGLQQLVHTVTAADPDVEAVQVLVNDQQVTDGALQRDPALTGPLWILDLEDGASVPRDFTLQGQLTDPTVSVRWELLRSGDVLQEGSAEVDVVAARPTWSARLAIADAGTYVVRASSPDLDPSAAETKTIVVR